MPFEPDQKFAINAFVLVFDEPSSAYWVKPSEDAEGKQVHVAVSCATTPEPPDAVERDVRRLLKLGRTKVRWTRRERPVDLHPAATFAAGWNATVVRVR